MKLRVTEREAGWRLDKFLQEKLPKWISRTMIQKAIKEGKVLVESSIKRPSYKVKVGEMITVETPQPKKIEILPENILVNIIYQDKDIVVVNKPAGMMAHPLPNKTSGTLVNALLYLIPDLQGIGGEIRPGIVHRLDKDTTGVMVVAKNDLAHNSLSSQFKERKVKKIYVAIARGRIDKTEFHVDAPIARHPVMRLKMMIDPTGKPAYTDFKVIKRFGNVASIVLAFPRTGRTHQIRLHLKYIGHPIFGDKLYGKSSKDEDIGIKRHMLHALKIGFFHPRTEEWMEFTAPFHQDFKEAILKLYELGAKK
ncbi:MAG: RluA family pseudouridine synthase [Thermotogaceae bacterium]|nr:RluA family pseudouridine synthase [Thermotogaceae bacterium]